LKQDLKESEAPQKNWGFFKKHSDIQAMVQHGAITSGGNFHGEYPAKAMDYLAIGVHEFAAISERRIERMCNPSLSGLPAFLVADGGFNSGFMISHCTALLLLLARIKFLLIQVPLTRFLLVLLRKIMLVWVDSLPVRNWK